MMYLLQTVRSFLKNSELHIKDLASLHQVVCPGSESKDTFMFMAALFTTVKRGSHSSVCQWVSGWTECGGCVYSTEFHVST